MCFADIFVARKQIFKILLVCTQHHTAAQQHYSCGRDASSVRMHLVVNYRKACVCDTFIIQDISTHNNEILRDINERKPENSLLDTKHFPNIVLEEIFMRV